MTICSSVNRVFFMAPSLSEGAPCSQASAGPKNGRQVMDSPKDAKDEADREAVPMGLIAAT